MDSGTPIAAELLALVRRIEELERENARLRTERLVLRTVDRYAGVTDAVFERRAPKRAAKKSDRAKDAAVRLWPPERRPPELMTTKEAVALTYKELASDTSARDSVKLPSTATVERALGRRSLMT